ncbi:hypothetical protein CEXT_512772 [Caerostris extrusa]|uniref:Uncharacterized protein n=1 Tax=Caerostris extrusa TaxID=172846 RepID=A0AAV4MP31_CAEEX|nr:hypothetical protein CEXT_512772 [Caerostris extrusa]
MFFLFFVVISEYHVHQINSSLNGDDASDFSPADRHLAHVPGARVRRQRLAHRVLARDCHQHLPGAVRPAGALTPALPPGRGHRGGPRYAQRHHRLPLHACPQDCGGVVPRPEDLHCEDFPQAFGHDPCPGVRKYAEVAYKCRPTGDRQLHSMIIWQPINI